ncbi:hypothetical protein [Mycolicibacterium palauense]|uniref:hypothetical protein n=1 Tax=Mycolicibacterium palauense TaxID=2034511 RepID=UPI000BFEFEBC|nr:hypothetical protein [Mycolicibacterium palauense]
MMRPILALLAAPVLLVGGLVTAAAAQAGPPPPCTFTLSAPQVTQLAGVPAVTATLSPADCGPPAAPYLSVACLQVEGNQTTQTCMQARGADTAHVFFSPYQPGTTYASTGRGCGMWIGHEPEPNCQALGPTTATL